MATSTTNFGLKKIDLTDVADITVINENWDKIDEQLLKAGESGGTDLIETEAASIIEGDAPEIDPVIQTELNKLDAELTQQKSDFNEYKGKTDVLESRPVNNNILINSNFANPVNQRGITAETWVTEKYGIDRWRITNPYTKVTSIDSNGITFCTTDTTGKYNALIEQKIEASSLEIGKTYTLSAHINGEIYSCVITLKADVNNMKGTGVDGLLLEIDARTLSAGRFELRIRNAKTTPLTVKWIKLEEGSVATPYVPRLYAEELELCRKYFREIELVATPVKISSSYIQFFTAFNAGTRILQPTVTPKGSFDIWVDGSITSGFSHNQITATDRGILWGFDKASHGLTSSNIILLNANIFVDAEL